MSWTATLVLVAALTAPAGPIGCPGQQAPPAPPAVAETAAPALDPLPWPAEPVGGPALGACGDIGPPSALPVDAMVIGAASFVLADLDTGAVLLARAPHARHRPASALKVLTALVALRELDLATVVDGTVEDTRIEGSRAGIGPSGRYTVAQLLDGLLLNSGNDTAHALARQLGGDAAMVAAMTAAAREVGALDTRPATPAGLDGPGMASSAYDLAVLFRVAMRDTRFAAIIGTRSVRFPGYAGTADFELSNSNRLLSNYPGALGGKSGFTDASRHTLVGAAERDGRRLVVAMVRGEQTPLPMWQQAGGLLDWGFALPAGTAPIGTLVDEAAPPVPPAPAATDPPVAGPPGSGPAPSDPTPSDPTPSDTAASDTAAAGPARTGGGTPAPLLALIGVLVAITGAGVAVVRSRARR